MEKKRKKKSKWEKTKKRKRKKERKKSLKKPLAYVFSCSLQNCSSDCVYWGGTQQDLQKGETKLKKETG